jgi:hypothetical protein
MKKIIITENQLKKLISEQETLGLTPETTPTNIVPTPVQDVDEDEDITMLDNLFKKD